MLSRKTTHNYPITNHNISDLDTLDILDFFDLSKKFPRDILNIIFEYAVDEKRSKIIHIINEMADFLTGKYTLSNFSGSYNDICLKNLSKDKADKLYEKGYDTMCTVKFEVTRFPEYVRHFLISSYRHNHHLFKMPYKPDMSPYQILGYIFNNNNGEYLLEYKNLWVHGLIDYYGYDDIKEFIYYCQHCNIIRLNKKKMWEFNDEPMMIYNRWKKNKQEQDIEKYYGSINYEKYPRIQRIQNNNIFIIPRTPKNILNIIFKYVVDKKRERVKETLVLFTNYILNYEFKSFWRLKNGVGTRITKDEADKTYNSDDIFCFFTTTFPWRLFISDDHEFYPWRYRRIISDDHEFYTDLNNPEVKVIPDLKLRLPHFKFMRYNPNIDRVHVVGHIFNNPYKAVSIPRCFSPPDITSDEFIHYCQHCNLWRLNEHNLWTFNDEPIITCLRSKNNQEQDVYEYSNRINKILKQISSTEDKRIKFNEIPHDVFPKIRGTIGEITRIINNDKDNFLINCQLRLQGLFKYILEIIPHNNRSELRANQKIPEMPEEIIKENYLSEYRLFCKREQELGKTQAFILLYTDRQNLLKTKLNDLGLCEAGLDVNIITNKFTWEIGEIMGKLRKIGPCYPYIPPREQDVEPDPEYITNNILNGLLTINKRIRQICDHLIANERENVKRDFNRGRINNSLIIEELLSYIDRKIYEDYEDYPRSHRFRPVINDEEQLDEEQLDEEQLDEEQLDEELSLGDYLNIWGYFIWKELNKIINKLNYEN